MKNVLLLFLSDVKIRNGLISEVDYENIHGEKTQTTNESAIRYLLKFFPLDKIFIFASKKVRNDIRGYVGEDGKPCTHLQFSLERFKKFLTASDYFVFDYDEDGTDDDNLKSIAKMAEHVQKFAADEEVTLHVDLTGGMRHVNMMMLELTRLLEYSGMTVGKILYSNYKGSTTPGTVEEIQNVYDLFQLISGVEEFVNFGSAKALDSYYKNKRDKLSAPLAKLLDAMKNFAEAIKLCHYGQFRESIENLHDAVHDFDKHESADVEDILMARLIERIRKNYHDLIANRDKDDLKIIRWCLENDYLQQALTLYTERIPDYLGEKKVIAQTEKSPEFVGRKNPWFYLFSEVKPNADVLGEAKRTCGKTIKTTVQKITANKSFDPDEWLASLNKELAPLCLTRTDTTNLCVQFETLARIFKDPTLLLDLSSEQLQPIRKVVIDLSAEFETAEKGFARLKILKRFLTNTISTANAMKYFPVGGFMKLTRDYPKATKMYELLVEEKFSVNVSTETFLSIADKYFRIKDERNHSAHAREDYGEFKTADKLREVMSSGLQEIQENLPPQ